MQPTLKTGVPTTSTPINQACSSYQEHTGSSSGINSSIIDGLQHSISLLSDRLIKNTTIYDAPLAQGTNDSSLQNYIPNLESAFSSNPPIKERSFSKNFVGFSSMKAILDSNNFDLVKIAAKGGLNGAAAWQEINERVKQGKFDDDLELIMDSTSKKNSDRTDDNEKQFFIKVLQELITQGRFKDVNEAARIDSKTNEEPRKYDHCGHLIYQIATSDGFDAATRALAHKELPQVITDGCLDVEMNEEDALETMANNKNNQFSDEIQRIARVQLDSLKND